MSQKFKLTVRIPNEEPIEYVLDAQSVSIGRHPDNQIQILVSEMSGKHCELKRTETGYSITDLGSSNGTQLNGVPLAANQTEDINNSDTITFGLTVPADFEVEGEAAAAATKTPVVKKKLALPKKKLATPPVAKVAAIPTATEAPSLPAGHVDAASPTVVLEKAPAPVAKLPAKKAPALNSPTASKQPALKKKLAPPPKKVETPVIAELAPVQVVEEEEEVLPVVPAPRKLAPPPKSEPEPEPTPEPVAEKPAQPAKKALSLPKKKLAAPKKLAPPPSAKKAEDATEPEPAATPVAEAEPEKKEVKLAPAKLPKKKLAAPKKLASPPPKAESKKEDAENAKAQPEKAEEESASEPVATVEKSAAPLDKNSKGVPLMRRSAEVVDPEKTPVLKKRDEVTEEPPSLSKKEELKDVVLKKSDTPTSDDPPKLVVPKSDD